MEHRARYSDGTSPEFFTGTVGFYGDSLKFSGDTGVFREIRYRDITEIQRDGTGVRIGMEKVRGLRELVETLDPEAGKEFMARYLAAPIPVIKKIPHYISGAPLWKKAAAGAAALSLVLGSFFALINYGYRLVPLSADRALGERIAAMIAEELTPCPEQDINRTVASIAERIIPERSPHRYSVTVIDRPEINALALPGGRIFIFSGLVETAESPDEVAAVLAHEISHVENRHGIRQLIRVLGISFMIHMALGASFEEMEALDAINDLSTIFVFLQYSKRFEREADLGAVDYLHEKGLSARGLPAFLRRAAQMSKDPAIVAYISTHPDPEERILVLQERVKSEKGQKEYVSLDNPGWKKKKATGNKSMYAVP